MQSHLTLQYQPRLPVPYDNKCISYILPDGGFAYKIINHDHAILYFYSLEINILYQTAYLPQASIIATINRITKDRTYLEYKVAFSCFMHGCLIW